MGKTFKKLVLTANENHNIDLKKYGFFATYGNPNSCLEEFSCSSVVALLIQYCEEGVTMNDEEMKDAKIYIYTTRGKLVGRAEFTLLNGCSIFQRDRFMRIPFDEIADMILTRTPQDVEDNLKETIFDCLNENYSDFLEDFLKVAKV